MGGGDQCGACGDGKPIAVGTTKRVPICEKCLDACLEGGAPVGPLFPKVCSCGASYDAEDWAELHLVGVQDTGVEILEMRNCPCHSTISIILSASPRAA